MFLQLSKLAKHFKQKHKIKLIKEELKLRVEGQDNHYNLIKNALQTFSEILSDVLDWCSFLYFLFDNI